MAAPDDLDLSAVRLFLNAVELGSLSQAARRLQIAQPSATAKLRKLERSLGQPLLERTPSGSVPTPAGARLVEHCAAALEAARELHTRAETLAAEAAVVTVAATRHVADHFFPTWLARAPLPDYRLAVMETDTLHAAQQVRAGDAAIGFTEGPAAPLGLRSRIVATEPIVAVVGRSHRWFDRRRPVQAAELADGPLILTRPGSGTRDTIEAALAELGGDAPGTSDVIVEESATEVRITAINGGGVAFLPSCWVRDQLSAGTVTRLPIAGFDTALTVRAIWRGAEPAAAGARALLAQISPS